MSGMGRWRGAGWLAKQTVWPWSTPSLSSQTQAVAHRVASPLREKGSCKRHCFSALPRRCLTSFWYVTHSSYRWDELRPRTWDPLPPWLQCLPLDKHLLQQQIQRDSGGLKVTAHLCSQGKWWARRYKTLKSQRPLLKSKSKGRAFSMPPAWNSPV